MSHTDRQTGRTTKQMVEAPRGATFVWVHDRIDYPRNLARKAMRGDLKIVGRSALGDGGRTLRGLTDVILDHAIYLSTDEVDVVAGLRL